MKTLKTIQTLAKIAKILSKITFIFCCIGFGGCVVGIISLALGAPTLQFGGVTLESIIQKNASESIGTMVAAMATGLIMCAGSAVVAKFAETYFKHELEDGTPFTIDGAKELLRLGIITAAVPLGCQVLAQIVHGIIAKVMTEVEPLELDGTSVGVGICFIVMALLCQLAAEQLAAKNTQA